MSIRDIIEHSVNKNPLGMKEALEEEMRERIALAIQAKMTEGSFDQEELDEENDEDTLSEMSDEDDMDDEDDDDDDDDDDMDEAACVREMKKLHAAACPKNEMYKKCNEKYGCTKEKFNELYASYCSK